MSKTKGGAFGRQRGSEGHKRYNAKRGYVGGSNTRRIQRQWVAASKRPGRV